MKLRTLLILPLILSLQICFAQKNDGKIPWNKERPLTWNDFKGRPDNAVPFHALTHGSTTFKIDNISGKEYKLTLTVEFVMKSSWVKKKQESEKLLAHEQLHFDLVEVYARIFIRRLEEKKVLGEKNFIEKANKIYKETFSELGKMQQKYDKETNHSMNEAKQQEWSEQIQKMLEENKDFVKREILFTNKN